MKSVIEMVPGGLDAVTLPLRSAIEPATVNQPRNAAEEEELRIGIQTISWGEKVDVNRMIGEIREVGYEGVELAQSPAELPEPPELLEILLTHRIVFLGIAGGSLSERIDYVQGFKAAARASPPVTAIGALNLTRPYAYVDGEYSDEWQSAFAKGIRLALHPHMFKPVQTAQEVAEPMREHPRLELLPDTAHLEIAGSSPLELIQTWESRLAAVHLKDWSPLWGRSYPFYARGFCELGKGTVDLVSVISWLKEVSFRGWVIVEQDYANVPKESARTSREWLEDPQ